MLSTRFNKSESSSYHDNICVPVFVKKPVRCILFSWRCVNFCTQLHTCNSVPDATPRRSQQFYVNDMMSLTSCVLMKPRVLVWPWVDWILMKLWTLCFWWRIMTTCREERGAVSFHSTSYMFWKSSTEPGDDIVHANAFIHHGHVSALVIVNIEQSGQGYLFIASSFWTL